MKIHVKGLVYNKYSGEIIGFTHLGDINNELMKLEQNGDHPPAVIYVHASIDGERFTLQIRISLCSFHSP